MSGIISDKPLLVYLALFGLACGSRSHETSCERVAETARAIHPGAYALTLADCNTHDWPESTRACAAAAKTRAEFTACTGAHLVVEAPAIQPPQEPSAPIDERSIVIDLHVDGMLFIDEKPLADHDVDKLLADAAAHTPQARVVLRADKATPADRVNAVVQRAKAAGLGQLSFATVGDDAAPRALRLTAP